jgi:predicted nucleotidyltransferase
MNELTVEKFSEILRKNRLLKKYGIEKMSLFGSFIRGKKFNDIDILVEEADNYDALVDFKLELESLTNEKVDIMIKKFANPIVLYRAQKDKIDVFPN